MDKTARSTSDASNKDPAFFPYTTTSGISGTPMAKAADMEIEVRQLERIAVIDSAVELVTIFANREPTLLPSPEYGSEPSLATSLATEEAQAYRAALAFLQMQYELEKPCLYVKTSEPPGNCVEPVVHMRAH